MWKKTHLLVNLALRGVLGLCKQSVVMVVSKWFGDTVHSIVVAIVGYVRI